MDRLWQFNQEGGRSAGRICRFDVGATRFIPRKTPESGATSSRMCSPSIPAGSRRCFLSVSGQPNGERCVTEFPGGTGQNDGGERRRGRKGGRDRGGANGIGEFAEPPRRTLRACEVKRDENGLLRNLWSGYT